MRSTPYHVFFFYSEDMLLLLGLTNLLLFVVIHAQNVSIGKILQARIVSGAPAIWLQNQSSWSQCMCYSLTHPSVVAFNSYPSNGSCQLFSNLSAFPFEITDQANVTIYLLQPLQSYTPCCSNLTWLLGQMKSQNRSKSIPAAECIALDTDRNRLGLVSDTILQLISADIITPNSVSTTAPSNTRPISYHQGLFYVGMFPVVTPGTLHIYAASNLTKVGTINFTQGSPQRIAWLFNNTIVCILIQSGSTSSLANFYNWPSNTLNHSVAITIANAFGLTKAPNDDTFVYLADGGFGN